MMARRAKSRNRIPIKDRTRCEECGRVVFSSASLKYAICGLCKENLTRAESCERNRVREGLKNGL